MQSDQGNIKFPSFVPHKPVDTFKYFPPEIDEKPIEYNTRQTFPNTYQRASVIRSPGDVFAQNKEFEQRNLLRYNAEAMILHGNILQKTGKTSSRNLQLIPYPFQEHCSTIMHTCL